LEVPARERSSKHSYIAHELKWEEIGTFKDIGDAAAATGLTPTTIRRICKSGFVYQKTFRGKMKSGKFLLEKTSWENKGEYPRLVDLAEYSGMSTEAIGASIKRNDTCGGKYKFEKVPKSNATLEAILP
jgi:hypothetical protein